MVPLSEKENENEMRTHTQREREQNLKYKLRHSINHESINIQYNHKYNNKNHVYNGPEYPISLINILYIDMANIKLPGTHTPETTTRRGFPTNGSNGNVIETPMTIIVMG